MNAATATAVLSYGFRRQDTENGVAERGLQPSFSGGRRIGRRVVLSGPGESGDNPVVQLDALVIRAEAQDTTSHEDGLTPAEFLQQRTELGDTLEAVYDLCEDGAPDPRVGNRCALGFAMRNPNDSARNAN